MTMALSDPLPPNEPLDRRVTIGLGKIGIALKQQAWAEAGGRGLTPTQGQVLALLRANPQGLRLGALAEQLGLIVTGSSDFHGTHKTVGLGAFTTDVPSYEKIVAAATGVPVLG